MKTRIFYALISSLLVLSLIGCTPRQKLQRLENKHPELFKPIVKDSISNTVQYVTYDSLINIPGGTVTMHDTFMVNKPCPTHFHGVLRSGTETATLNIDSGKVTVICKDDSLKQEIVLRDKIISTYKEHTQVGVAEHDVFETHWYDYFCRTVVGLSLLFLLIWVLMHSLKLRLP